MYQSQHSLRSIELRWSYANDHTCPVAREASWSSKQPQPITANSKSHVWVGPDTIFRWLKCVLNEGCVQFGPHMYRQTSGVFMGTSQAPELANDFAFSHEYEFLTHKVNEHIQYGPGRYLFDFISQHTGSTKRYIDDIFTVSLGRTIGPSLQDIILQNGVFYGMYPTTVREFDGSVWPSPISIVRERVGPSIHFLDMEIIQQPFPELCSIEMYDKRDNMPTLTSYRRFLHIETDISVRCKYGVLHSQLCRLSYLCTQREYFIEAASRLIRDMYTQGYDLKLLRRKLYNFQSTF